MTAPVELPPAPPAPTSADVLRFQELHTVRHYSLLVAAQHRYWTQADWASARARAAQWTAEASAEWDRLQRSQSLYASWLVDTWRLRTEVAEEQLRQALTGAQRVEVSTSSYFHVTGSLGGRFRIHTDGHSGNVFCYSSEDRSDWRRDRTRCAHLRQRFPYEVPTATHNLAQKQLIELDEDLWMRTSL